MKKIEKKMYQTGNLCDNTTNKLKIRFYET